MAAMPRCDAVQHRPRETVVWMAPEALAKGEVAPVANP
jgi:hypothetical protein